MSQLPNLKLRSLAALAAVALLATGCASVSPDHGFGAVSALAADRLGKDARVIGTDDDANTLTLSDADGTNLVTISVDDGKIRLQCSAKVIVEAPKIELTDGATHPVVFGDELMSYFGQLVGIFNSHMHPGETALGIPVSPAPPVPPFTPAPPSLISQRVTTG